MPLQEMRKKRGLTQSQLAENAKINVRTLQYYEQGVKDINGAKLHTLLSLAHALDCNVSDIVTDQTLIDKIKKYSIS